MNNNIQYILTDCISKCTYHPNTKHYIEQAVMDTITFSDKPSKFDIFQFGTDKIILAIVPLSICFHNRKFDVSVKVYFMKNIPNEPPQFFLLLTPKTAVNPRNTDIDPHTYRIFVPTLRSWNPYHTFRKVLEEITMSFTKTFPLYKKVDTATTVTTALTHNPGMINQSYLGQQQQQQSQSQYAMNNTLQKQMLTTNIKGTYEQQLKLALIESCLDKVINTVVKEKKSLEQQNAKINNYKTQFNTEIQKISTFMNNIHSVYSYIQTETNKINNEITKVKATPIQQQQPQLNEPSFMKQLIIGDNDKREMSLLAKEVTYEEYLTLIRKACEKGALTYTEAKKMVTFISKDLFRISYKLKQQQQQQQ